MIVRKRFRPTIQTCVTHQYLRQRYDLCRKMTLSINRLDHDFDLSSAMQSAPAADTLLLYEQTHRFWAVIPGPRTAPLQLCRFVPQTPPWLMCLRVATPTLFGCPSAGTARRRLEGRWAVDPTPRRYGFGPLTGTKSSPAVRANRYQHCHVHRDGGPAMNWINSGAMRDSEARLRRRLLIAFGSISPLLRADRASRGIAAKITKRARTTQPQRL